MIQDLQFIVLSYLSFEEILSIFDNDPLIRDKFIKIYKPKIPKINRVIKNGDLRTLKYLLDIKKYRLPSKPYLSIKKGYFRMAIYLYWDKRMIYKGLIKILLNVKDFSFFLGTMVIIIYGFYNNHDKYEIYNNILVLNLLWLLLNVF